MPMFSSMEIGRRPWPRSCRRLVGKHPLLPFNRLHDLLFGISPKDGLFGGFPNTRPPIIDFMDLTPPMRQPSPGLYPPIPPRQKTFSIWESGNPLGGTHAGTEDGERAE